MEDEKYSIRHYLAVHNRGLTSNHIGLLQYEVDFLFYVRKWKYWKKLDKSALNFALITPSKPLFRACSVSPPAIWYFLLFFGCFYIKICVVKLTLGMTEP